MLGQPADPGPAGIHSGTSFGCSESERSEEAALRTLLPVSAAARTEPSGRPELSLGSSQRDPTRLESESETSSLHPDGG